jgi:hypothetical protein
VLVELGVVEQRYRAVLEVLDEGAPGADVQAGRRGAEGRAHPGVERTFSLFRTFSLLRLLI